jgi:thymidylate synthase
MYEFEKRRFERFSDVYEYFREQLIHSYEVGPRGMTTKEVLNAQFTITDARSRLIYHEDRKFNLAFAIAEAMTIINGTNEVEFLSRFNKNVAQFSDNDLTFYGSYGPRLEPYWIHIINKLKSDKDSRQAIMNIYESKDMTCITKDVPCTLNLHFMIRNNKLNLTTYMRSNDFFWGTQYDVFTFTLIQEMIANILEIDLGMYTHNVTSLHVYEKHYDMLENIQYVQDIKMPEIKYLPIDYDRLENYCRYVIGFGANMLDKNILQGNKHLFYSILAKKLGTKFDILRTKDRWAKVFYKNSVQS